MKPYLLCPTCDSDDIVKNGRNHRGKQSYKCKDCGRKFVENPANRPLDNQTKEYIDRLLLERTSLAGIARVLQISESSLQKYVNETYEKVPQQVNVFLKEKGPLTVQMDELWSFVDSKGNKQWVWLAIDAQTREIVGCYIGNRSGASALALWKSLPAVYRQCGVFYTDHLDAYGMVLPNHRHRSVDKDSGLTSYIERLNNTLRQRVSRLVRKSLSFSKKLENHIGAIWNFIHDYNHQIHRKLQLV